MWKPFSPKSTRRRRGLTLIEIVAGLVVLAVLISALTIARGRFLRAWSQGQRKLEATAAVDRMLAGWIGGGGGDDAIPVPGQGALNGVEGCTWRTNWMPEEGARRLGAGVVRLEVMDGGRRVLAVEVMKHVRERAEREER
jgi:prepilin-type N-terminal cleavage/methylation domain-containing protein